MKQVLVRQGEVVVHEVAAPLVEPGTVLIRVAASCISVGTEMTGVQASGVPLWKRALAQPAHVKRVVDMVASQGIARTFDFVRGTVGAELPIGYSAAGTVLAVGEGVEDLSPGDRVAGAGAQCAFHAEVIRVPRNLCVPVPDAVGVDAAATVTLGAIALQGVRRLAPTLGETFVVVGLGLLGQLTVQMLKANGCRVIGLDLDPKRADLAVQLGLDLAVGAEDGPVSVQVQRLTGGIGADGVVVTASSASSEVLNQAFRMCRKKGRVVLVGDVPIAIDRGDIYAKELDFLISTSYGPGRYDRRFEEEGADYPVAFVRWTENRNMLAYLDLLAAGRVTVAPLVGARYGLDDAPAAYAALKSGDKPLMVLLDYPDAPVPAAGRVVNPRAAAAVSGALRIALIGAGAFAKAVHLPNLKAMGDAVTLRAVISRTGHGALVLARQFGAAYSATDVEQAFSDPEVDAVVIATRHDSHGSLVLRALEAGKHVFVEKPLALTADELDAIEAFYAAHPPGSGADDRFQPALFALRQTDPRPFGQPFRPDRHDLPDERRSSAARPLDPRGGGRRAQPGRSLPYLRSVHRPDRGRMHANPSGGADHRRRALPARR